MIVGIGVDMVEIQRVQNVVERHQQAFIKRVFTNMEQVKIHDFLQRGANARAYEYMSGRFAVKEAVAKALGTGIGQIGWQEIEVQHTGTGAPVIVLSGQALELAGKKKIQHWHVSISHTGEAAVAFVIAES